MPKQLTRKEKLFACVYAKTRDARAAAACAGFAMPQLAAHRLLARDDVSSEIRKQIEGAGKMPGEAAQGSPGCVYDSATGRTKVYSASASRQAGSPGLSISANGFSLNSAAAGNCEPCLNEAGADYFYVAWK